MYSISNQMPALNLDASGVRVEVCDKMPKDNGLVTIVPCD